MHPTHRTPYRAVTVQFAVVIVLLVAMGLPLGADNMFNLFGTTGTFTYVIIYGLGNIAAWRYFRTAGRDESSVIKYVIFPLVATAALLYIAYKSYIPLPAAPVVFAPVIVRRLPRRRNRLPAPGRCGRTRARVIEDLTSGTRLGVPALAAGSRRAPAPNEADRGQVQAILRLVAAKAGSASRS